MTITRLQPGVRMSQGVIHANIVYLAGQVGTPGDSVSDQTKTVLYQIDSLLAEAGTHKGNLLNATVWLSDIADFTAMNAIWDVWLDTVPKPARATGEVKLASPAYKVEIIVTAAIL